MTTDRLTIAGAVALAVLAGCASSEGPKPMAPATSTERSKTKDTVERTDTVAVQAKVISVDQKTRMVAIEGPDGNRTSFRADERVKNLAQVHKGDMITVVYQRAIAAKILKKGQKGQGSAAGEEVYTAKPGEKPAALGGQMVQTTATVTNVDRTKNEVTLKGPKGNSVAIAVEDPSVLDMVKKGDRVDVTYSEAVAISVDKPQ